MPPSLVAKITRSFSIIVQEYLPLIILLWFEILSVLAIVYSIISYFSETDADLKNGSVLIGGIGLSVFVLLLLPVSQLVSRFRVRMKRSFRGDDDMLPDQGLWDLSRKYKIITGDLSLEKWRQKVKQDKEINFISQNDYLKDLYFLAISGMAPVIAIDIESDVVEGNNAYGELLNSMSAISGGSFEPQDIEEEWQEENGVVYVKFMLKGFEYTFDRELMIDRDCYDLDIVGFVNFTLARVGKRPQFQLYLTNGQLAFISALDETQLAALKRVRSWK